MFAPPELPLCEPVTTDLKLGIKLEKLGMVTTNVGTCLTRTWLVSRLFCMVKRVAVGSIPYYRVCSLWQKTVRVAC